MAEPPTLQTNDNPFGSRLSPTSWGRTVTYVSGSDKWLVAESEGDTSNSVFEILQDWEHQLKHRGIEFEEPQP